MSRAWLVAAMVGVCVSAALGRGSPHADRMIADLRADGFRWNAIDANHELRTMADPPIDALGRALDSEDWQQRQMAADVLWWCIHPPAWAERDAVGEATPRLLEVTVEGLRHDGFPTHWVGEEYTYTYVFNASRGFRMLVLHAHEARGLLEAGLESGDVQQRFLCALALGFGGVGESAPVAAPVLLPHLRDNDIREDAKWVVAALYRFGPAVLPMLREALPGADEQQQSLLQLLILDLTDPPAPGEDPERVGLNKITRTVFDPAVNPPRDDWMGWVGDLRRVAELRGVERAPESD
ncbi:MAG: hypothetical protein DHS20C14_16140 [Phycisphaeraceae bacterium]|nr:MAG: hypothetical protein DHS20C14_16140 [Phycisphaeraceae bacterium]